MATTNRILGISSGFDTETLVKQLMDVENLRLDKLEKDKQYTEWQQEGYSEIVSMLTEFQSTYFDVLNPEKNMASIATYGQFSYDVLQNGISSSLVTVSATADLISRNHTINSITQLATADVWTGNDAQIRGVTSSGYAFADFKSKMGMDDFDFNLSIGGKTKSIQLSSTEISAITNDTDLVNALNQKISSAFGSDYTNVVTLENGELNFDMAGNTVTVIQGTSIKSLAAISLKNGQSSTDYREESLSDLFGLSDTDISTITINGVDITLSEDYTIDQTISAINQSDAGVKLTYNSLLDKFELASTTEGTASNIDIEDGSSAETFFNSIFGVTSTVDAAGDADEVARTEGQNAILSLDGASIIQSSNTFTYEGITYNLKGTTASEIDINVETNEDAIVDVIKSFITDYNNIIDYISTKTSEKKNYDFEPLTDDEKADLSDTDIELWEAKAKSGVLRNSSELNQLVNAFRNAFVDKITTAEITLNDIGISSTSYTDKGKLTLDEDKLRSALENDYEKVVSLFTNESSFKYADAANNKTRYSENGLAFRLKDVLKDYIRTTRDTSGQKGILIEKVGIENDASYYSNYYADLINDYDERISDMMDLLSEKENSYYTMFASMESALAEMQSQYDSLFSSLGSS